MRPETYYPEGNITKVQLMEAFTDARCVALDALTSLAKISFLLDKVALARVHLSRVLDIEPEYHPAKELLERIQNVERLNNIGRLIMGVGAISKFTEALNIIGEDEKEYRGGLIRARLLSRRAIARFKHKDWVNAEKDTRASLSLDPALFEALRLQARLMIRQGSYDAGIEHFGWIIKQAIENEDAATSNALRLELVDILEERAKTHRDQREYGICIPYLAEAIKHAELLPKTLRSTMVLTSMRNDCFKAKMLHRSLYFRDLGVKENAGMRDIAEAYQRESSKYCPQNDTDPRISAFEKISEAFKFFVMYNPDKWDRCDNETRCVGASESERQKTRLESFAQYHGYKPPIMTMEEWNRDD